MPTGWKERVIRAFTISALAMVLLALSAPAHAAGPEASFTPDPSDTRFYPGLAPGAEGEWVRELQDGLRAAGFHPGPSDGVFGGQVVRAVHAFQKVHQLPRDGIFRPSYWALLEREVQVDSVGWAADRVEVDLGKQVLYLVRDGRVTDVLSISSGNGEAYRNRSGRLVRARTPEGAFTFNRHISGWRRSYLGVLYEPFYFRGGYAIHGSPSVPPWPASHGCIRVGMVEMDWLKAQLRLGMPVYVYGLATERPEPPPEPPPPPDPAPLQIL